MVATRRSSAGKATGAAAAAAATEADRMPEPAASAAPPDSDQTGAGGGAKESVPAPSSWATLLLRLPHYLWKFWHFWTAKQFQAHRLMGAAYLIQYFWLIYHYVTDYPAFLRSPCVWTMPVCGAIQSFIAMRTFTFLPAKKEAGYIALGDVGALSYNYVVENSFFASLLTYQWIYYTDSGFRLIRRSVIIEHVIVFLPYLPLIRHRWPVSSFRDSLNSKTGVTQKNRSFYYWSILRTKYFYIFAKHYIGFYMNYMRYLGRIGPEEQHTMYGLLLGACWGTTVAMFIHTLRFKHYISARTATLAYQASFPWMGVYFVKLLFLLSHHKDIFALATLGLLLNNSVLTTRRCPTWHAYQIALMAAFSRGVIW